MSESVTPKDVADDAVLLDVREDAEWRAGHAPGAVHIPLADVPARVSELPEPTDGGPLPVVCKVGGRSAQAVQWLQAQGYEVVNVEGGMKAWAQEGKKLVADHENPEIL